ncbi:MAG: signal peptidase II [Desulfitobacterium hafniense]|nr:signal peptidase II [Desulfitobacterium hafniense]
MPYFFIIIILIIIDQLTKHLAETYLTPLDTYPIINNVFHLTFGRNTGAAFSILQGKQIFLIIVTSIITIAVIYYLFKNFKKTSMMINLSLTLIASGALGNLIDRIRFNYVRDFLDFTLISFPLFNFADIFVSIGSVTLAYIFYIRS